MLSRKITGCSYENERISGLAPVREMVAHVERADWDRPAPRFRTGAVGIVPCADPVPTDFVDFCILFAFAQRKGSANMSTALSLPPGPKGLPFIGHYLDYQRQPLHFTRELQRNYGAMATAYFGKSLVL